MENEPKIEVSQRAREALATAAEEYGCKEVPQAIREGQVALINSEIALLALTRAEVRQSTPPAVVEALKALLAEARERGGHLSEGEKLGCAALSATHQPQTGKYAMTEEWCINMAKREGDAGISAGMPDHPLRAPQTDPQGEAVREAQILGDDWQYHQGQTNGAIPQCSKCGDPSPEGDPCKTCAEVERLLEMSDEDVLNEATAEQLGWVKGFKAGRKLERMIRAPQIDPEVIKAAEAAYNDEIDNDPDIHTNRFPIWSELSVKERNRRTAAIRQQAAQGDGA